MKPPANKTEFILSLLDSGRFEKSEHERLLRLATNEIHAIETSEIVLRNEIESIKEAISKLGSSDMHSGNKETSSKKNTTTHEKASLPHKVVHEPQKLVNLLSLFSRGGDERSSALKHSVHEWFVGADYESYDEFMKYLKQEFLKLSKELKALNQNLFHKCSAFILYDKVANKGWGPDRIKIGWSSPELANWCKKNPTKNPQDFRIPREFREPRKGIRLNTFEHVITRFKYQIEVRRERPASLATLFLKAFRNNNVDKTPIARSPAFIKLGLSDELINDLESVTFYTDVQWLEYAFRIMFKPINERLRKGVGNIKVELAESDNFYKLMIIHNGSFNDQMSVNSTNKLTILSGDFENIRNKLHNLCDWTIETRFKEGAYRLNYLVSDETTDFKEPITDCNGFTHVLTFYKPSN